MGLDMTDEEIDAVIDRAMMPALEMVAEVLGATLDRLLRQAYSLGFEHGVEHQQNVSKPLGQTAVGLQFSVDEPANAQALTDWDKERLANVEGISARINGVLAKNGIFTVGDVLRYEQQHADEGGLCKLHYFGEILKAQLYTALTNEFGYGFADK